MRIKPYNINGKTFSGKNRIYKYFRNVLASKDTDKEEALNEEQTDFVVAVLKCHPDWENRAAKGIDHISIDWHETWGNTRCLYLNYADGTRDSISFKAALKKVKKGE